MRFLTSLLMLFSLFAVSAQEPQVRIITQPSWPPGKAVVVTVEIDRGGLEGFARFSQDLPQGFYVEPVNPAGADFYWENDQVNVVWLQIPDENPLVVQYLVTADKSLGGSFRLEGRFDIIKEGKVRSTGRATPQVINLDSRAEIADVKLLKRDTINSTKTEETGRVIETPVRPPEEKTLVYRVQVAVSSQNLAKEELENRIGCKLEMETTILRSGTMYKYQSGSFEKYSGAEIYLNKLREKGVTDAFIVAYRGQEQIPVEIAQSIEK